MKFSYNKYSIRSKNLRTYRKIILMLAVIFPLQLMAQSVSNLRAQFTGCKAVVNFTLTSGNAIDLTLMYTGDGGKTWLPCTTVSGDITGQTTGNKQIVWDCYADGIRWGLVEFKINLPQTGCGSTLMEMVKVTGGTFQMGSTTGDSDEQLVHSVTLSDFCIGKYEVTQKQWYDIMGSYPGTAPSSTFGKGDNYPMYNVSWNDIVGTTGTVAYTINGISYRTDGYCYKLSYKADAGLSQKYRLPTEAEWEYASRGGAQSKGYTYSGSNTVSDVAWYSSNSSNTTHTVGTRQPNELGIYDMSGNVWEWCSDWYGAYSSGAQTNPTGAASGSARVIRGGGWDNGAANCTVSSRAYDYSDYRSINGVNNVGFRLVLAPQTGCSSDATITDIDGNIYHTITIGTQIWMMENLKTTKYNDGTAIPNVTNNTTWAGLTTGAYCYYINDAVTYKNKYGCLYNWYAVNTGKLAPKGWHVPTDAEWTILENYLIANGYNYDGSTSGNYIAKSLAATTDWSTSTNTGAIGNDLTINNQSCFSALPGGCRGSDGLFNYEGYSGVWWSSTQYDFNSVWGRALVHDGGVLVRSGNNRPKCLGYSVRCVKD